MKKDINKKRNIRLTNLIEIGATLLVIIFANVISSYLFTRFDLTAEKRYTLSTSTKTLLKNIDEPILFRIYLDGDDLPAEYRRFRTEIKDMLDQFRAYNRNVEYEFTNPNDLKEDEEIKQFHIKLGKKGVSPVAVSSEEEGVLKQQWVYPIMEASYRGNDIAMQLQSGTITSGSTDEVVNRSIENLEYNFVTAIRRLTRVLKPRVGFLLGHGELEKIDIFDIQMALVDDYSVENVRLNKNINTLTGRVFNEQDSTIRITNKFDVIVVPKPIETFSDMDLYILDQYVMYGGKILWLVDAMDADMDSLQNRGQTFSTRLPIGLDEMMFNYGVRLNSDLIMDYRCRPIPLMGADNRMQLAPWYYFPTLVPQSDHPIVRNLDVLKTDFIGSIDLIDNDIKKTILLTTSDHVHIKNAPVEIQLGDAVINPEVQFFNKRDIPVAVLLEGKFKSMWRNRLANEFTSLSEIGFKGECEKETQMIVISDGDMIRNGVATNEQGTYPLPLGYDRYTQVEFANKNFILNAINYLAGDEGLIDARPRNIAIRRLDAVRAKQERGYWQAVTLIVPIVMVLIIAGGVFSFRHYRYKKKTTSAKR